MLNRLPGESDFEYHRRLVYGKMRDKTLADVDYCELSVPVLGAEYSSDSVRKYMYGSMITLDLLDKERDAQLGRDGADVLRELDDKKLELRKESQRMFDQRTALNKVIREVARAEELNDMIKKAIREGGLPSLPTYEPVVRSGGNDLLISLNDVHYGAIVDNYWCKYSPEICRQMMRHYLNEIAAIALCHQSKNCIVWANGDMISGNIHYEIAMSNRENLVQQVMGVSELIAWFLAELSGMFEHVYFTSVAGNHSRIGQKDKSIMNERLDDLVQWYLEARMAGFENVTVGFGDKIDTTMYVINVRGKNYVGVHGDYEPSPANIQTLQTMAGIPVYAVLCGHRHHNETSHVSGIRTVMAGSFQGMDSFCIQRRIYGKPEQMVCVCDDRGIRCHYDIDLSECARAATA